MTTEAQTTVLARDLALVRVPARCWLCYNDTDNTNDDFKSRDIYHFR